MDQHRIDTFAQSRSRLPSRRDILRGLVGAGLGLGGVRRPDAAAKQRRKPQRNAFGCVDVGKPCRGDDRLCCSGICQGKKPKTGKKDTSRCVGHDATSCQAGEHEAGCGGTNVQCTTSSGLAGQCNTTTGNAGFCLASSVCFACRTDADCQKVCGARAACLTCTTCVTTRGTMCGSPDDPGCP